MIQFIDYSHLLVNSNEMHPSSMTGHIPVMDHHMSHGPYTSISQPPPIYHHGIPAPDLSAQQHMHCKFSPIDSVYLVYVLCIIVHLIN